MARNIDRAPVIVVIGAINMDLIGVAERIPEPGETLVGERFYAASGGKGANQAVAAAKLGATVRMVGRVGDDDFGTRMLAELKGHGVDVSGIARDPDNPSGTVIILLDSSRENRIVAIYGANDACDGAEVEAAKAAMDGADTLLLQLEVPVAVSIPAAEYARAHGITVVWDPAPARDMPEAAMRLADVLTPNQTEARYFTGIDVHDRESGHRAADALLERGARAVVVKLGEEGVCFADGREKGFVPAFHVEAVDTVAAGDAFGAAMAVALAEGKELAAAVRYGAAAGALAVTRPGAQDAMPARREVEALFSRS